MKNKKIVIATRASKLALTQSQQTLELLQKANPDCSFELLPVTSTGDRVTDKPLSSMGGVGVFVKELEKHLSEGTADLAIHSLKDVPSAQPDDLVLAGFPKRASPFDLFLTRGTETLATLVKGARIGTGSPRRIVQLKAFRPDFEFIGLRGNLDTRIKKLNEGQYDAIVVACAGMFRLGVAFREDQVLDPEICLPAIGQGALVIECRKGDKVMVKIARSLNDERTEKEVAAERSFMVTVGAGCSAPVAAFARILEKSIRIEGMIGDLEAMKMVRTTVTRPEEEFMQAGKELAIKTLEECKRIGVKI